MEDIMRFSPLWGEWIPLKKIEECAFDKVYTAMRQSQGRTDYAAIKHISLPSDKRAIELLYAEGIVTDAASTKQYLEQVMQKVHNEISLCMHFKGSKNFVTYEDYLVIPKSSGIGYDVFIRMELLESLPSFLARSQLKELQIIKLGMDISTALAYLEQENYCHRDIKPGNIYISPAGDFKLADFGTTRELSKTRGGLAANEMYNYIAPEVQQGKPASHSADLYSLGLVLYWLCNYYRKPFLALPPAQISFSDDAQANKRRLQGEPLPPPPFASAPLQQIILRLCAFNSLERYHSAQELYRDLSALFATRQPSSNAVNAKPLAYIPRQQPQQPQQPHNSQPRYMPPSEKAPAKITNKSLYITLAILCIGIVAALGAFFVIFFLNNDNDSENTNDTALRATQRVEETQEPTSYITTQAEPATQQQTEPPTTQPVTTKEPDAVNPAYADFDIPESGFIFQDSDRRYISEWELEDMTENQVCIARNEIFARHHRKFSDPAIAEYFNSMDWYIGTIEPSVFDKDISVYFNEYEQANIKMIAAYEDRVFAD